MWKDEERSFISCEQGKHVPIDLALISGYSKWPINPPVIQDNHQHAWKEGNVCVEEEEDCVRRKGEIIVTGCDLSEGYLTPTDVIHLLPACYLLVGKVNGRRGQNYPNTQPLKRICIGKVE